MLLKNGVEKTHIYEDGIDIIGAVVALKGSDVGPEIVGCKRKKEFMY